MLATMPELSPFQTIFAVLLAIGFLCYHVL